MISLSISFYVDRDCLVLRSCTYGDDRFLFAPIGAGRWSCFSVKQYFNSSVATHSDGIDVNFKLIYVVVLQRSWIMVSPFGQLVLGLLCIPAPGDPVRAHSFSVVGPLSLSMLLLMAMLVTYPALVIRTGLWSVCVYPLSLVING